MKRLIEGDDLGAILFSFGSRVPEAPRQFDERDDNARVSTPRYRNRSLNNFVRHRPTHGSPCHE